MKISPHVLTAMLLTAGVLGGCQSPTAQAPPQITGTTSARNNCYSLLHQLLEQQKDVSLLRFIKREEADVKNLVKKNRRQFRRRRKTAGSICQGRSDDPAG